MKVSVITTLFNYKHYIGDCIDSFLAQKFPESEMVIVDDCSTDNPEKVINKFKSDKIEYIRLDENGGYSHAKNVGIKASKAEILVMLDADDMLLPNSIEIRYKKIGQEYDFVHGPAIDLRGHKRNRSKLWDKWKSKKIYKHVHAQGVMLKKQIHREIGLYDESLRSKSDREMWARIFNHGYKVGTVDKDVVLYRMHDDQMHKSPAKLKINDKLQKQVLKKIDDRKLDLSDVILLKD